MNSPVNGMDKLLEVVERLRAPNGCAWDRAQTMTSLQPCLLEEVYEVFEAIERADAAAIEQELGDLLFVVALIAQVHEEHGGRGLHIVAETAAEKMKGRHPHVFAGQAHAPDWEATKQRERGTQVSQLSDIPASTPALLRAQKVGKRAACVGFDWPDLAGVRAKVDEELSEMDDALTNAPENAPEELGDVMFTLVQFARSMDLSAEVVLHRATRKFEDRFRSMEAAVKRDGQRLEDLSPDDLDARWQSAKKTVRA